MWFRRLKEIIMKKTPKIQSNQLVERFPDIRLDMFEYAGESCIDKMTEDTLELLNKMCHDAQWENDWNHRINSSYREGNSGQHPFGRAVDIVFYLKIAGDLDVWEQFRFAKKYPWGGIGTYPFWNAPGLHVDTRQGWNHVATWWRDDKDKYRGIAEVKEIFGVAV